MYGRTIPAGAKVLLLIGSANRDSEAFPDGDTFRIDRPEKGALASFGAGVHFCLGAHIQLTEVQPEARVRSAAERSLS